jgi:hypothetical protein
MVEVSSQEQVQQRQEQIRQQQSQLSEQQRLLQNPNLLRKRGYGYLLSPAGKKQRLQALSNIQTSQQQLQARQQELQQFQQRLKSYEDVQRTASKIRSDYEIARKFATEGKPPFGLSKRQRGFYRGIRRGEIIPGEERLAVFKEYEKAGFKLIVSGGRVIGYEDTVTGESIAFEEPKLSPVLEGAVTTLPILRGIFPEEKVTIETIPVQELPPPEYTRPTPEPPPPLPPPGGTTGGFTTPEGTFIVTPSGEIVGSAPTEPFPEPPTPAEILTQQSLLPEFRYLPEEAFPLGKPLEVTEAPQVLTPEQLEFYYKETPYGYVPRGAVEEFTPPSWIYPEGFPTEFTTLSDLSKVIPDPFPRYYYKKGRIKRRISEKKIAEISPETASIVGFGTGVASGALAVAVEYPAYFLRHPIETVRGLGSLPTEFYSGELSEVLGAEFRERPAYATGFVVGVFKPGFKSFPGTVKITRPTIPTRQTIYGIKGLRGDFTATLKIPESKSIIPNIVFSGGEEFRIGKIPTFGEIYQEIRFARTAKQEVPSSSAIKAVETDLKGYPTARERATVLLKDSKGNYILDESGLESSKVISYGGLIEKGESPRLTALRELGEETGLKVSKIKFEGKQVFPEEIHYIFTKTLTPEELAGLRNVRVVNPSEAKGITGQSYRYPFTKNNIRVYELALINWLESGKKAQPTWLYSETSLGKYYYGTQSRYDITPGTVSAYGEVSELTLAHGTQNIPIAQLLFKKKFKVEEAKSRRGEPGLYVQPPIAREIPADVKRLIGYTGKGEPISSALLKDLPFDVPKAAAPGYIGLSYLIGGAGEKYQVAFKLPFQKRGAILLKEALENPLKTTRKAVLGKENELLFAVGTEIKTIGKRQVEYIGGRRVILQPAKVIEKEPKTIREIIKSVEETPIEYIPLRKYGLGARDKNLLSSINIDEENLKTESKSIEKRQVRYKEPAKVIYKEPKVTYGEPTLKEISYPELTKEIQEPIPIEYTPEYPPYTPEYPPYFPPYTPRLPPRPPVIKKKRKKKERFRVRERIFPGYEVFVKRRGKFVRVATGLPRGRALRFGTRVVERELSRQFKIAKSGVTRLKDVAFRPSERFRRFKQRRGKRIPLTDRFIQKTTFALSSEAEKIAIKQARQVSQML